MSWLGHWLPGPKLLLLDEPAAGLNPTEVEDFIKLIYKIKETFDISILLIEHRLQVVHTLSDKIYVLNFERHFWQKALQRKLHKTRM